MFIEIKVYDSDKSNIININKICYVKPIVKIDRTQSNEAIECCQIMLEGDLCVSAVSPTYKEFLKMLVNNKELKILNE